MHTGQKEPGEYRLDLSQDSKTFFRIEICWILTKLRPCFRNCVSVAPALAVTHQEKRKSRKKVLYFRQKWRYFHSENGFGILMKIQYMVPGLVFSKKNSFRPPSWFNHHFLLKIAHSGATGPSISGIFYFWKRFLNCLTNAHQARQADSAEKNIFWPKISR